MNRILANIIAITGLAAAALGQSNEPVKLGPGMTPPKLISKVEPEYSMEARFVGANATVAVELVVDETGAPQRIAIAKGAGFGLDEKAVAAVALWRFAPAQKDGFPVAIYATVEVSFRLFDDPLLGAPSSARISYEHAGSSSPVVIQGRLPGHSASPASFQLTFDINEEGEVRRIIAPEAVPESIRADVQKLKFRPAMLDGHPVRAQAKLSLLYP